MTIHIHELAGCSPVPLAHYLKAMGILRLVAEQKDSAARGWWKDESFYLATTLDQGALTRFFLDEYQPTPLIAPWNGGSGFYPKDNKTGIDKVVASPASRFACYRDAIKLGRDVTVDLAESPKGKEKNLLIKRCRQTWRSSLLQWLDASLVINSDGESVYPAMLGTGGNDGRLDFTNNFMQRLAELFDCSHPQAEARPASEHLLGQALYRQPECGLQRKSAIGQFLPGGAGGANSSTSFGGDSLVNPWDFVLMLEGSISFAASVIRRANAQALPQAAAPFAVRSSATGFGSAAETDKTRGEQWMPLWNHPATINEIQSMIAEGRSQIGTDTVGRPVDFGRAIARLGVARGITSFQRYGYIERNGQANLAVPLGRWTVQNQPHQDLIDEIAGWVARLRRAGADKHSPASIGRAARNCEESILACCSDGHNSRRWQDLLIALGLAEINLVRAPRFTPEKRLQPLPRLSDGWLSAANDGSAELRLATALASQHGLNERCIVDWRDPVRRNFLPLEVKSLDHEPLRFHISNDSINVSPEVACIGDDLQAVSIALVRRRLVEAGQKGLAQLTLMAVPGAEATLIDLKRLMAGELDEARILHLARPLMALDWRKYSPPWEDERAPSEVLGALGVYGLLRLAHWPQALQLSHGTAPVQIRLDPAIFPRLAAGDLPGATNSAIRRLSAAGLRPNLRQAVGSCVLARRLAMALAFPIQERDAATLALRLTRPQLEEIEAGSSNLSIV